jgi:hypothetical protein
MSVEQPLARARHGFCAPRSLNPRSALWSLLIGLVLVFVAPMAANAQCAASGATDNCSGAVEQVHDTSPGITTLNVGGGAGAITQDIVPPSGAGAISLTGGGAAAGSGGDAHYSCSVAGDCTIVSAPNTADTCTVKSGSPDGTSCVASTPANGPSGNSGPSITVNVNTGGFAILPGNTTSAYGVVGRSNGDNGGNGGNSYVAGNAGDGSAGADGGTVKVSVDGNIVTQGLNAAGIAAVSQGGNGGNGGSAYVIGGDAGNGGAAGFGGAATAILNFGSVTTGGDFSVGVGAVSQGGNGGSGGGGGGLVFSPGGGNNAGQAGFAEVQTSAGTTITTYGQYSHGVEAQSQGGGGGGSAGGFGLFYSGGGGGGTGGNGGQVQITNGAGVTTNGDHAVGLLGESIGGGGGDGATNGGLVALGASGGPGGSGGVVTIDNTGTVTTTGQFANAIEGQSIGGGGGNGGSSGGLVSLGGDGSGTTVGGTVTVGNTGSLSTNGAQSSGIFAQSIGGGGGNGGTSYGLFSAGGSGGSGANGDVVTVVNSGDIETGKDGAASINSMGIFAQSVGGGGGNGGGAIAGGPGFSAAFGGSGGTGGSGANVVVKLDNTDLALATASSIITHGDESDAVLAQSVGGGGGNGGFAVSGSVGPLAIALGVGGSGGPGGGAGTVNVTTKGSITTYGLNSDGVFAQSVGGGGGNGGASIAIAAGEGFAVPIALGGSGGTAGDAQAVTVAGQTNISTTGADSAGLVAQSVGGGGGNGGFAITGSIAIGTVNVGIGGRGGAGGIGSTVTLGNSGSIATLGDNADGVFAQSVGGGGGNGGFSIDVALGAGGAATIGVGGTGGAGQSAGAVSVDVDGGGQALTVGGYAGNWNLVTEGKNSAGVVAQSIGGGGGSGGYAGSVALSGTVAVGVAVGGGGLGGGDASTVQLTSGDSTFANNILTLNDGATGILAQSVGGGGGSGGYAVAISGSGSIGGAAAVGVGGTGGVGGIGMHAEVDSIGNIETAGALADGIISQSIGGGGGNGGFAISGAFTGGLAGAAVAVGGDAGAGSGSGDVVLNSTGAVTTLGAQSTGLFAQSIGGGGGNGGFAGALSVSLGGVSASVGVGGLGGTGGKASTVELTSIGDVTTAGDSAAGVFAQSVGGGGGNGGSTVGVFLGVAGGISVNIGRAGGSGGDADTVTVDFTGNVTTGAAYVSGQRGSDADGILAQSIGGGGGNGGFSGALSVGGVAAASVGLGGHGGGGGDGGAVNVTGFGDISTAFNNSAGLLAQSVGGGGGNGGFSIAVAASGAIEEAGASGAVAIGGSGGGGGAAKDVTVINTGTVSTQGQFSDAILAQSVGGGGGNGGFAVSGAFTVGAAGLSVGIGGSGTGGGTPGDVTVDSYSVSSNGAFVAAAPAANVLTIETQGAASSGIFAQSVGGGGGNGGFAGSAAAALQGGALAVTVGGFGGTGADAGSQVTVNSYNNILTEGQQSFGIFAQSVGGGGGNGGFAISLSGGEQVAASVSVGGFGNSAGDSHAVTVNSFGNIETLGTGSVGLLAQSIGGGGGNGGFALSGALTTGEAGIGVSVGGLGKSGGAGGLVIANSTGDITTQGLAADGILAQSVGGGGGNGGFAGSLAIGLDGGALGVSVGGFGAGGGGAMKVTVDSVGNISTLGAASNGIFAQSVGGGGGNGGGALGLSGANEVSASIDVGGFGGGGGLAGAVEVDSTGSISTVGALSNGIWAQSIGGGGGNGGFALSGSLAVEGPAGVSISVGGFGGAGQDAAGVVVNSNAGTTLTTSTATIQTQGADANGIFAQSVGGSGGGGGFSGALALTGGTSEAAVSLSLGGFGGIAGDGKTVNVTSVDNILTTGVGSNGLVAQSIGGGGGNGGFSFAGSVTATEEKSATISASVGGFGAAAGDSGLVTVNSTGLDDTSGAHADGVLAQSIGGGGGNGGFSAAATLGLGDSSTDISASVGGFGGAAGNGGGVSLTRNGATQTAGDYSVGLMAQSIGGGGGNGGLSISGAFGGTDTKNLGFTLGGFGGAAGNASEVDLTNTGAISTAGIQSQAIFAQSVGGGGGVGGLAVTGIASLGGEETNLNLGVTVGGFGGAGGMGAKVNVINDGLLLTTGNASQGILAQSIGGGGGAGGGAVSGLVGLFGASEGKSINANVVVGGFGGAGNISGDVYVDQTGGIETTGDGSHGIDAESIGGGGGKGGQANSIALILGKSCTLIIVCKSPDEAKSNISLQLTVGGNGGSGNDAGTVTVINNSAINTSGAVADGIFAQSVGGGGGEGGNGVIGTQGLFPNPLPVGPEVIFTPFGHVGITKNLAIAVGGSGGGSGDGELVTVTNSGAITVTGDRSAGIFAQSIGGGGGTAGNGVAGLTGAVGIGGGRFDSLLGIDSSSGNGGVVTITNKVGGDILTTGTVNDDGIFAQSVGAGGGQAGSGSGFVDIGGNGGSSGFGGTVTANNAANIQTAGLFSDGIAIQSIGGGGGTGGGGALSLVAIGGSGGSSGVGGAVLATNSGDILTTGDESNAVSAQSVGGGGGRGGGFVAGSIVGDITSANVLAVGGSGSTGSAGGTAEIDNSGGIETFGKASDGLLAQSVGGGGGIGGGGLGLVTIGGAAGGSSAGGAVTVQTTASSQIVTHGDESTAILAQSVGGGGGIAGETYGVVGIGRGGSGGGDGGVVLVANAGQVETFGANATAILAQSVGGGGGVAIAAAGLVTVGGNGGDGGNGGAVTVDNTGAIQTSGANAQGVFAQSIGGGGGLVNGLNGVPDLKFAGTAGGLGAGGAVIVTDTADIAATGANSFGILAQSQGSANSNIAITVTSGTVEGGTGTGAGVGFLDGANNTLTNHGLITDVDGFAGQAISGGAGNEAVSNFGAVWGSVGLGGGANSFHNQAGGVFLAGPTVDLGAGGLLTNDGVLQIGKSAVPLSQDVSAVQATHLTGDFVQTASGHLVVDLAYGALPSDQLNITGKAVIGGTVDVTLLQAQNRVPVTLITTTGGATLDNLVIPGTLAFTFTPVVVGDDVDVDLTSHFQVSLGRHNAQALGGYLNTVVNLGGSGPLNDILLQLGQSNDLAAYRRTVDLLSADPYLAPYQAAMFAGEDAASNVLSCKTADTTYAAISETGCAWVKASSKTLERAATSNDFGFSDASTQLATGIQQRIAPNLLAGVSLGWDDHTTTEKSVPASVDGHYLTGAAALKWQRGPALLALAVSGGSGQFKASRQLDLLGATTAVGNFNVSFVTTDARAGWLFEHGAFYAKPLLDLSATYTSLGAFSEVGAGAIGSQSRGANHTTFAIKPQVEFGTDIRDAEGVVLRPWVAAGVAYRPNAQFDLPVSFVGGQAAAGTYSATTRIDRATATLDAGFDIIKAHGYSLSFAYTGEFGQAYGRQGGRMKLSIPF